MALSSSASFGTMGLSGSMNRCGIRRGIRTVRQGSRTLFGLSLKDILPSNGSRVFASTWLENSAQVDVDVPLSLAWDMWSERENMVQWMPWISSVKVLKDKPELSRWTLRTEAFGQHFEFSWLARNLQPIYHQKIHWRSEDGLPNRGAVRFYPRGSSSCRVQLTISYEVPDVLASVGSALAPFVEGVLKSDLERFAKLAQETAAVKKG